MIEIKAKLKIARSAYRLEVKGRLRLPFALRQGGHGRAQLESGEEVALKLPRGEMLRGGDLVAASDGRVIEVVAQAEKLLHAEFGSQAQLAAAAYHLGARHAPVQVGEKFLRIAAEPALAETLRKLGAAMREVEAPFEPEAGSAEPHAHEHGAHEHHEHGHHHHHRKK